MFTKFGPLSGGSLESVVEHYNEVKEDDSAAISEQHITSRLSQLSFAKTPKRGFSHISGVLLASLLTKLLTEIAKLATTADVAKRARRLMKYYPWEEPVDNIEELEEDSESDTEPKEPRRSLRLQSSPPPYKRMPTVGKSIAYIRKSTRELQVYSLISL